VKPARASTRRRLDRRLEGLDQAIGFQPPQGWIRTMRDALGMRTYDLAIRMGLSQSRASRLQRAEVDGFIKLDTLARAAAAMNCRLCYVFVPEEPLVSMVQSQARAKAAAELAATEAKTESDEVEVLEARAYELIDSWDLWGSPRTPL
jgi:predicted DNA-binding mobile mystery protein A